MGYVAGPRSNGSANKRWISQECSSEADAIAKEHSHSFGDKPLIDVSTNENPSPDYAKFQTELLSLSQNSRQLVAEKSGHFVIIDRPDVVIDAVSQAVQAVRKNVKLYSNALPQN